MCHGATSLTEGTVISEAVSGRSRREKCAGHTWSCLARTFRTTAEVPLPRGPEDAELVHSALLAVDAVHLADRPFDQLSGGERQRVLIARALAQQPTLLVLDEPTDHLDVRHQLSALGTLRRLPATVLLALHDLNLAAYYCDRLYVLHDGEVTASGPPAEILTPHLLAEVYGVAAEVATHPRTGAPQVTFLTEEPHG
ncbi:ABC transporter ATP-binding protein [Streptomyces sp. H-KF8]|uniref:ABC transporter ATP-binding protein n=1 Tax=Streptomyces sp. H-KF8 TaxID=1727216 RepID=UPI00099FED95|nr:ABC transporter ATP-binding protein [Streptomyces sp. H-KF8]